MQEQLFLEGLAWVIVFIETGDGQDLDLRAQIIPGIETSSVKSVRWTTLGSLGGGGFGRFDLCGGDQTGEVIGNEIQGFLSAIGSAPLFTALHRQFMFEV